MWIFLISLFWRSSFVISLYLISPYFVVVNFTFTVLYREQIKDFLNSNEIKSMKYEMHFKNSRGASSEKETVDKTRVKKQAKCNETYSRSDWGRQIIRRRLFWNQVTFHITKSIVVEFNKSLWISCSRRVTKTLFWGRKTFPRKWEKILRMRQRTWYKNKD